MRAVQVKRLIPQIDAAMATGKIGQEDEIVLAVASILEAANLCREEAALALEHVAGCDLSAEVVSWMVDRYDLSAADASDAFVRAVERDQLRTASELVQKFGADLKDSRVIRNLHHAAIGSNRRITALWISHNCM